MCWTVQRADLPQDLRHHSSFMALLQELGMGCGAVYYRHGALTELFHIEHSIPLKTARNDVGTMPSSNRHACSKSPSPTGQPWSNLPQHSPLGSNRFKVRPPCQGRNRGRLRWDSRAGLSKHGSCRSDNLHCNACARGSTAELCFLRPGHRDSRKKLA